MTILFRSLAESPVSSGDVIFNLPFDQEDQKADQTRSKEAHCWSLLWLPPSTRSSGSRQR